MAKVKKIDLASVDIIQQKKNDLKKTFPEVFAEGKIDFEKLRLALGEMVEMSRERYGMNWPGKTNAIKVAQEPSVAALKPDREASVDFDNTKNLFIEGDNLEVLKLLQKSYFGKVKMIYIDPPYNTGKEFIYPDKYAENLETYLQYTGQIDAQGKKFSSNTETDGRYHSKWMNMMWPRLFLARNLLRDDGVIFISIDDHESDNLKKICNEVFGEENFVGNITWEKRTKCQNTETAHDQFQSKTEYILVYKKIVDKMRFSLELKDEKVYDLIDEKGCYREKLVEEMSSLGMRGRKTMIYPIQGIKPKENKQWKIGIEQVKLFDDRGDVFVKEERVYFKIRPEDENSENYMPFWSHFFNKDAYGTAETGKTGLSDILGTKAHGFETVKPVTLIKKLLSHVKNTNNITLENNDIVLDFFAGSGTTAHAVIDLNREDGGNRQFIMVQLPEPIEENSEAYKAGFKDICDIGEERIRLVIKKIKQEESQKLDLEQKKIDLGFKVFKLGKSNFSVWEGNTKEDLEQQLQLSIDNIAKSSTPESILYELLLKAGYGLEETVEKKKIEGKTAYFVSGGKLSICLEKEINQNLMKAIAAQKPEMVICLNSSFATDADLTNAAQIMKSKQIEFRTV